MEAYSLSMAIAVRQEFNGSSPERLAELAAYYLRRQGPGLGLLREEYQRRGLPFPVPTSAPIGINPGPFPPACPVCGQQRNKCICSPQPHLLTADMATQPHG